ncbi:hypothetical protein [Candidatus Scalindua japonica]|uniref:hypothetical protein n=1 Tax=Candidatus Scalindua japonica TaxID=1284222 RepID=UPI000BDEAB3C|nr:hypothetical protein [Candidatus Scalindua japonica]
MQNFFLTHPGNRGRTDIRCPLGCRAHHKKAGARKRCAEYYQTEDGKKVKKTHNRRRYELKDTPPEHPEQSNSDVEANKDKDFMGHMAFIMSLTEGRRVDSYRIQQIYQTFFQNWRQQGLEFWQEWCKLPGP